jgi:hypothetical protein
MVVHQVYERPRTIVTEFQKWDFLNGTQNLTRVVFGDQSDFLTNLECESLVKETFSESSHGHHLALMILVGYDDHEVVN